MDHLIANINFQPASTPVPFSYLADTGEGYGLRDSGLTYGWDTDNTDGTRDRNVSRSPDERYDTLAYLSNAGRWAIAVPDGLYQVHIVAGDGNGWNSNYQIDVEGTWAISGKATSTKRWFENTLTVNVTDGALTVTSHEGAVGNKLCFIDIQGVDEETPLPTSPPAKPTSFSAAATSPSDVLCTWDDNSDNEEGFVIQRKKGNNGTWATIATVGADSTSYIDSAGLLPGTRYVYRVRAYNAAGNSSWSNTDGTSTKTGAVASTTISWSTKASNPFARAEALGGVVNGKLYVLGGLYLGSDGAILATARCDVYNPATNSWTRLSNMPERLTHAGTAIDGDTFWFVGAYVGDHPGPGTTHVWKYNTTTDTWSRGPDLPAARGAGGAALLGRKLHYFGGMDETRTTEESDHWVLDLDNQSAGWVRKADLINPRNHTVGIAVNGYVYCLGGQYAQEENQISQGEIDRYDPSTDTWTHVATFNAGRSHIGSATFLYNNKIMVLGGETGPEGVMRNVTLFDPVTNTFTEMSPLPSARSTVVAGLLPDGRIIASTGNSPLPTSTTWIGTIS